MILSVVGTELRALIAAVTKFPSVGAFVGSENVNLQTAGGILTATTFGIVVARAKVKAQGDTELFAVDSQALVAFAGFCGKGDAKLDIQDKEIWMSARGRKVKAPKTVGSVLDIAVAKSDRLTLTAATAKTIEYLSQLAVLDQSRPELCCVMLSKKKAMAMSGKAAACLPCSIDVERLAVPIPLARIMHEGSYLRAGKAETVLESGIADYMMPSPVEAQQRFPLASIAGYEKIGRKPVAVCDGSRLSSALAECRTCLGQASRTEVVVRITVTKGRLRLQATNGGIQFERVFTVDMKKEADIAIPMDEGIRAAPLFADSKVTIAQAENGASFFSLGNGWVMFPSWSPTR